MFFSFIPNWTFKEWIKAILTIGGFLLIVFLVIHAANSQKITPATAEQVAQAIEEQGYEAIDATDEWYEPNSYLIYVVSAEKDDFKVLYFIFENDKKALDIMQQIRSFIYNYRYDTKNKSYENAMANFTIYTIHCNNMFSACTRVGNTVFYAECSEQDSEKAIKIMDSIGYLK